MSWLVKPSGRPPPRPPARPLPGTALSAAAPSPAAFAAARRGSPPGCRFLPFLLFVALFAARRMPGGRPGTLPRPPPSSCLICFWPSRKFWMSALTCPGVTPEPPAIRARREPLMILGLRRSSGVIDCTIAVARSRSLSLTWLSSSLLRPAPGSMPSRLPIGPSLRTIWICSTKSSRVKPSPETSRSASAAVCSSSNAFSACSIRVSMSPMSRMRDAIRSGWKTSKSSSFSPAEANMIGRPVSCVIDSAAPPRASPSSLVSTTPS